MNPADRFFVPTPDPRCAVIDDGCAPGLTPGEAYILARDTSFYGAVLPAGTRVAFTRYAYDKPTGFPIVRRVRKVALFLFPDGSERSLMAGAVLPAVLPPGAWLRPIVDACGA